MPRARSLTVDLGVTRYYHCVSRCVRRAWLCGEDATTGRNYDHRKGWLEARLQTLSTVFAVDVCAYAVMSNHFHLVVKVDVERAEAWTTDEVIERYGSLFRMAKAKLKGMAPAVQEETVELWRERLSSLSWLMRSLNEWLARRANKEDGCRGRFWEGRFVSQPLLDEAALLTCMAYVDLNPIRAGHASTLEGASFTSIRTRLARAAAALDEQERRAARPGAGPRRRRATGRVAREGADKGLRTRKRMAPDGLAPFADQVPESERQAVRTGDRDVRRPEPIPMDFVDYVELLEATGRHARAGGGRGVLDPRANRLLSRLKLDSEQWRRTMAKHGLTTYGALGSAERLTAYASATGRRRVKGIGFARLSRAA